MPQRLAIFGAGVMGVGITTLALGHGVPVTLIDVDDAHLQAARARIDHETRMATLMGALPAVEPGELTTTTSVDAAADADVVIEAITEQAELKAKLFGQLSGFGNVVITNTSSVPVDELAAHLRDPARLIGTHFMNPSYLIRTVEVIRGARTADATLATVIELLTTLGRQSVVVKDSPGFVTSRVLHPMINTAARVVQAGTASAADVDALMQGCLGHPTGPLRTADLIGIDNLVDSLVVLHERTGDESCRPCDLLLDKVRAGDLGRKSGRGFYDYGGIPT